MTDSVPPDLQVSLVDPIPSLVNSAGILTNPDSVAAGGVPVVGAAADGVAQLLVRISGGNANDSIQITLNNDAGSLSTDPAHDGYLTSLDGSQSGDQITTSVLPVNDTTNMAFAIYHAPINFARTNGSDMAASTRNVSIQIQDGSAMQTQPVQILRPPELFIHGLWSDKSTWSQFVSAMKATIPSSATYLVDYSGSNGASVDFNTPYVLAQASFFLNDYKKTYKVAATQMDFIVHSMGGLIANNMPTVPFFRSKETYGHGYIHKLITIDTPYKGSPFAAGLSQSSAACKLIFNLAGATVGGAVEDMVPDSRLLKSLDPLSSTYYSHAISGGVTPAQNLAASAAVDTAVIALQENAVTDYLLEACYSVFVTPLTAPPLFTFDDYFGGFTDSFGGANDLIVSVTSQLGPFVGAATDSTIGFAHFHVALPSPLPNLVFIPSVLDAASPNPGLAITLLNTDVSQESFE
jgi:hypothetical protein